MTAFERRVIKTNLVDTLEAMGFDVLATDSADIIVSTDKPINKDSFIPTPKHKGFKQPYMTSFGPAGALKFIEANRN